MKKLGGVRWFAVLLAVSVWCGDASCDEESVSGPQSTSGNRMQDVQRSHWESFLTEHAPVSSEITNLDAELSRLGIRSLTFPVGGGTGYFYRVYLVDDFLQILILCDSDGLIRAKPECGERRKWRVLPDGSCFSDTHAPARTYTDPQEWIRDASPTDP